MTLDVEIRPAKATEMPYFRLRPADERECWAGGLTGWEAVQQSIRLSTASFEVWRGNEILGFYGYAPHSIMGPICTAWMLTCIAADHHPRLVARMSRQFIRDLHELYPTIQVICDREHVVAMKWLQWLGFNPTLNLTERLVQLTAERAK